MGVDEEEERTTNGVCHVSGGHVTSHSSTVGVSAASHGFSVEIVCEPTAQMPLQVTVGG